MEVSGHLHAPVAFHPSNERPVPTEYEAEWAQVSVLIAVEERQICPCRQSHSPQPVSIPPELSRLR